MKRDHPILLIISTLLLAWLWMQAVHELGHVVAAVLSGGEVTKLVLHPLAISRTDIGKNPQPLLVVWAGPMVGVFLPLALWTSTQLLQLPGKFLLRFFAGFCLVANGLYLAIGSFVGAGDCGDLLRLGTPLWQLWLFGAICVPAGFFLWHNQGPEFGLGSQGPPHRIWTYVTAGLLIATLAAECLLSGR